ncbi:MAG: ABC transporter permease [Chloroflexi bacterium]|nr:ABC transporter permease [Chloroflexota bacterium]
MLNFNHLWLVFHYELRRQVGRRGYLFMTLGIPLIAFVLLFGYKVITDMNAANAPQEQQAQQDDGANFAQAIRSAGYVDFSGLFPAPGANSILTRYDDETAARAALEAGTIDAYYIISADYLESGEVTMVLPSMEFGAMVTGDAPIEQLIFDTLGADINPALLLRLRTPTSTVIEVDTARATQDGDSVERNFGADFGMVYIFALALMLGVFTTNGYLMQSVIDEKESRLIEILISSIRPTELLAGKILALGLLGLLQIVVWLGALIGLAATAQQLGITGTFLNNLALPWATLPLILLFFVLGYLFFAAAYGMIGALSNSMQEGPQYAVIFTLPAAIPLYFIGLFIDAPNDTLAVVLSLVPITAPMAMVQRLVITAVPALEIIISVLLLLALDIFMMWMAGKLFRVQSLLAGQLPKLRDIPKLLRG